MPAIRMAAFLIWHLNPFGASACFWWIGQSMCELAPYTNDARAQRMILLGGVMGRDVHGYHGWNSIPSQLGLLK